MLDVITIGSAIRDVFLPLGDISDYRKNFELLAHADLGNKVSLKSVYFASGGGGTNTAVTFSRLGFKTAVLTVIGADEAGKSILKELKSEGINTSLVKKVKSGQTAYSVIILSQKGERTAFVFRGVSDFKKVSIKDLKTKKAYWFFLTSLGGNLPLLHKIFECALKNFIKIAWNPGGEELKRGIGKLSFFLKHTNVLLLNNHEAAGLAKIKWSKDQQVLKKLQQATGQLVVVTGGHDGAWAFDGLVSYHIPTIPVKVVNATGAGDAFGSGFLAGLIKKDDIETALKIGIVNSTNVIQKMGAKNGIINNWPSKEELTALRVKKFI